MMWLGDICALRLSNQVCSARCRSFVWSTQVWKHQQLERGRVCGTGHIGPRGLDSLPPG